MSDSEQSQEEPEEKEEVKETKKKKKKKNRKKKKEQTEEAEPEEDPVDADEAFLNSMIDKAQEEGKRAGYAMQGGQSVLKVDKKLFNFQRELNSLFHNMQADVKEQEEEKREGNGLEDLYEGASKRQKRLMKQQEKKMAQKQAGTAGTKRFVLVQPKPNWPRDPRMLKMHRKPAMSENEEESKGGLRFTFAKEPEYVVLQKEFEQI